MKKKGEEEVFRIELAHAPMGDTASTAAQKAPNEAQCTYAMPSGFPNLAPGRADRLRKSGNTQVSYSK